TRPLLPRTCATHHRDSPPPTAPRPAAPPSPGARRARPRGPPPSTNLQGFCPPTGPAGHALTYRKTAPRDKPDLSFVTAAKRPSLRARLTPSNTNSAST